MLIPQVLHLTRRKAFKCFTEIQKGFSPAVFFLRVRHCMRMLVSCWNVCSLRTSRNKEVLCCPGTDVCWVQGTLLRETEGGPELGPPLSYHDRNGSLTPTPTPEGRAGWADLSKALSDN